MSIMDPPSRTTVAIDQIIAFLWDWIAPILLVCIVGNDFGSFLFSGGRWDQLASGATALALLGLYFHKDTSDYEALPKLFAWGIGLALFVGVGVRTRPWFDFINLFSIGVLLAFFAVLLQD